MDSLEATNVAQIVLKVVHAYANEHGPEGSEDYARAYSRAVKWAEQRIDEADHAMLRGELKGAKHEALDDAGLLSD